MATEYAVWWHLQEPGGEDLPVGVYELGEHQAHQVFRKVLADPGAHAVRLMRREVGSWETVVPMEVSA
jgi:hypothetical protein